MGEFISARLKIAVLIKRFIATGGAERYAVEVTRRLLQRGHMIDLYARQVETGLAPDMEVVEVPDRLRFSSVLNSWSFAAETAKCLRDSAYDVILSHERGHCQDLAVIHTFAYKLGVENYSLLKKLNSIYLSPRSWLHLRLERQQMASPWLVPVSNTIKTGIQKYYGRRSNIRIATPGVDIDWFHPDWTRQHREMARRAEGIRADELVVLFVGSEFRRKGLDMLINAIEPGTKLLVVGAGERHGYYRRLAARKGEPGQVLFKGLVDDVRRHYAAANVVALPSRKEAFGMSVLEGMACGLPVVCSDAAGVSALVTDGANGYLFQDTAGLQAALSKLKHPEMRRRLGHQARLTAVDHAWDATTDAFEQVCRQIAADKRSRPNGR